MVKDIYFKKIKISRKLFINLVDKELYANNYILDEDVKEFQDKGIQGLIDARHLLRYKFISLLCYNKNVLDYGCGDGYGSYFLSKNARLVIGFDLNPKIISIAKKKYKECNLIFKSRLGYSMPYDIISCVEVLEHIHPHDIDSFITILKDRVKDNGLIVFTTPRVEKTKIYQEDEKFKKFLSHYREYDKNDFINILKRNKLKIDYYMLQKFDANIIFQPLKNVKFHPMSPRTWVQIAICSK